MAEKKHEQSQIEKFREAATEAETDDSEEAFDTNLRKIALSKPPIANGEQKKPRK